MIVRTHYFSRAASLAAFLVLALSLTTAKAATFTIDSSQSFLSIVVGGDDNGSFLPITTPQQPGSDLTNLLGTLELSLGGTTIGINSAAIGFGLQPTDMEPLPGGVLPGAAPANYGLIVDLQGIVVGPGAARNLGADLGLNSRPLVGNSFDVNGALLSLIAGALDINLQGFTSVVTSVDISGNSGPNSGGLGTLISVGDDGTLTIPVFVEALVPVEVSPGFVIPLIARFEGQIVATGTVPEPSSMILGGLGLVGLGLVARRRRARS